MEKYSAILETAKQNVKAVNFTSKLNGLPAHGFQIKDLTYGTKATLEPPNPDKLSQGMETEGDASGEMIGKQGGFDTSDERQRSLLTNSLSNLSKDDGAIFKLPGGQMSPPGATNTYHASGCQDSEPKCQMPISGYVPEAKSAFPLRLGQDPLSVDIVKIGCHTEDSTLLSFATYSCKSMDSGEIMLTSNEKLKYSNDLEQNHFTCKNQLQDVPSPVQHGIYLHDSEQAQIIPIDMPATNNCVPLELCNPSSKSSSPSFPLEPVSENCDMCVCPHEGITTDKVLIKNGIENMQELPLASSHTTYEDGYVEGRQYSKMTHRGDKLPLEASSNTSTNFDKPIDDVMGELKQMVSAPDYQEHAKSHTASRRKGKSPHQPFLFPFKHFLKPRPYKRKHRK